MLEYDYMIKVVLIGDETEGKTYFASKFCEDFFVTNYKFTIGIGFYVKTVNVLGKLIKLQLWDLTDEEKFKTLFSLYFKGALGAIIISDISKPDFRNSIDKSIQRINEEIGDIPIIFLTFNGKSREFQTVFGVETMFTADLYDDSSLTEIRSIPIQSFWVLVLML